MISHNILYFTNIIYNIEKKLIRNYKLSINITFLKIYIFFLIKICYYKYKII